MNVSPGPEWRVFILLCVYPQFFWNRFERLLLHKVAKDWRLFLHGASRYLDLCKEASDEIEQDFNLLCGGSSVARCVACCLAGTCTYVCGTWERHLRVASGSLRNVSRTNVRFHFAREVWCGGISCNNDLMWVVSSSNSSCNFFFGLMTRATRTELNCCWYSFPVCSRSSMTVGTRSGWRSILWAVDYSCAAFRGDYIYTYYLLDHT